MSMFKITLNSLYDLDPDLFRDLVLPEMVDRQLLIDTLIDNYGDCAIAHRLESMRRIISQWGIRNRYRISGLLNTTLQKYNPVENYDRYEETSRQMHTAGDSSGNGTNTDSNRTIEQDGLKDVAKTTNISSGHSETDGTDTNSSHIHGNIGVTTAAQMLAGERQIVNYDLYMDLAQLLAHDLVIPIFYDPRGYCCG